MERKMIDFFKDGIPVECSLFGICDDEDKAEKTPAYVDCNVDNRKSWIAEVNNSSGAPVKFIAVDNKIEILREDGNMENRCDAMLHNEKYIIFVELKNQRQDWIKHAVEEQLATTINIFKQNHDISVFRHKFAYACNKQHPSFASSHKEYMHKFRKEHGVRLVICNEITIKA